MVCMNNFVSKEDSSETCSCLEDVCEPQKFYESRKLIFDKKPSTRVGKKTALVFMENMNYDNVNYNKLDLVKRCSSKTTASITSYAVTTYPEEQNTTHV